MKITIKKNTFPTETDKTSGENVLNKVPCGDTSTAADQGRCFLTFCCHSSCHCKNNCCCCRSSSYEVSAELALRLCDLCALGGPLYSWNLIVRVFACDLLLLFFRFLSLPGAGCCMPWTCSGSDEDEGVGGGAGAGGGEATELIGDRLDVDEPRGEGSRVRVTIPAFAAAVSIMS